MPSHPVVLRLSPSATPPTKDRCRVHDGDVLACDATPGCAYYYCSQTCWTRGTSTRVACPASMSSFVTSSVGGYSREFASFFWGAALGGALVFGGVLAAVLMKFLFSPGSKNDRGERGMGFGSWLLKETTRAIHGETTPRYDGAMAVVAIFAFLFSLVDLVDLFVSYFFGTPIDFSSKAGFFSVRLPIVMVAPLLFIRLWKVYVRPIFIEGRKLTPPVARTLRVYLVMTIAVTTSILVLFAATLFYLFLLWAFSAPNFDPLQTSRPFSYVFVTLPIAATHFVLFRWLRKHLERVKGDRSVGQ